MISIKANLFYLFNYILKNDKFYFHKITTLKPYNKAIKIFMPKTDIYRFRHQQVEYYLNGFVHDKCPGVTVVNYNIFHKVFLDDAHEARKFWRKNQCNFIEGGWHFSYIGGINSIIKKIKSFSHSEYDTPEYLNRESILRKIENGENIFNKQGDEHRISYIKLDGTFPKYLVLNKGKYNKLFKENGIDRG